MASSSQPSIADGSPPLQPPVSPQDLTAIVIRLDRIENEFGRVITHEKLSEVVNEAQKRFIEDNVWKSFAANEIADLKNNLTSLKDHVVQVHGEVMVMKGEVEEIVNQARSELQQHRNALTAADGSYQQTVAKMILVEKVTEDTRKAVELMMQHVAKIPEMDNQVQAIRQSMKSRTHPTDPTVATPSGSGSPGLFEKAQDALRQGATGGTTPMPGTTAAPPNTRSQDPWHQGAEQPTWGGAPHQPRMLIDYGKLFDPKLASTYTFDGRSKADEWVRRTRNFFLGRCRSTEWMLDWAEKQASEITPRDLYLVTTERGEVEDTARISQEIWSFLNGCLTGEGQITFGLVPNFNGLEAWRRLTRPVTAHSASRRVTLGQLVRNPPAIRNLDDVMPSLERYENTIKDFVMAGGSAPNDEDKCNIVVSKLPANVQERVLFKDFTSYTELKHFLQEHVQRARDLGVRAHSAVHAMHEEEEEHCATADDLYDAIQHMPEGSSREEILAAVQYVKGKGKGGKGKSGPRRCYNCGEIGHIAAQCPKPKGYGKGTTGKGKGPGKGNLEVRTCYKCGKVGHIAANCNSNAPNAAAMSESEIPYYMFCLLPDKPKKPLAVSPTTLPVNVHNRFQELARCEEDENGVETMETADQPTEPVPRVAKTAVNKKRTHAQAARTTTTTSTSWRWGRNGDESKNTGSTLSLLDDERDDLCTAEDYEYVMVEGILDSGSVAHVMDKHEAPGYRVQETAASRRGQMYTGAGGEKIANEGELDLNLLAENDHTGQSHEIRCKVQAAKVTRPLFSVGKICDNGIDVLFRKGYAVTIDAKTGKEITRHPRENGTYRFKVKLRSPKVAQPESFHRQGA